MMRSWEGKALDGFNYVILRLLSGQNAAVGAQSNVSVRGERIYRREIRPYGINQPAAQINRLAQVGQNGIGGLHYVVNTAFVGRLVILMLHVTVGDEHAGGAHLAQEGYECVRGAAASADVDAGGIGKREKSGTSR